ncbi:hypothetical protein B0H16DRAFT_525198 [Mycena metata]|uniref:Uncharacterized protein n=1 Tax=Mycena metata TaxID=1033252 RepID=A0AAD7H7E6_9AGAR|nr:hypothetical protein B0H16DRAFT_525198 [Mycena metata]
MEGKGRALAEERMGEGDCAGPGAQTPSTGTSSCSAQTPGTRCRHTQHARRRRRAGLDAHAHCMCVSYDSMACGGAAGNEGEEGEEDVGKCEDLTRTPITQCVSASPPRACGCRLHSTRLDGACGGGVGERGDDENRVGRWRRGGEMGRWWKGWDSTRTSCACAARGRR